MPRLFDAGPYLREAVGSSPALIRQALVLEVRHRRLVSFHLNSPLADPKPEKQPGAQLIRVLQCKPTNLRRGKR